LTFSLNQERDFAVPDKTRIYTPDRLDRSQIFGAWKESHANSPISVMPTVHQKYVRQVGCSDGHISSALSRSMASLVQLRQFLPRRKAEAVIAALSVSSIAKSEHALSNLLENPESICRACC
jgi:hypothetical protein